MTTSTSNSIFKKVQNCLAVYLDSQTFSWDPTIVTGLSRGPAGDDFDLQENSTDLPKIVCNCTSVTKEGTPNAFIWMADCSITLTCNADDTTEDEHLVRTANTFDPFFNSNLIDLLNATLTGITVQWVRVSDQRYEIQNRSWQSVLNMTIHCTGIQPS